jgi:6-phosphogluconolactonase
MLMTTKIRALLISIIGLATMWTAGCGHYTCGQTFGSSSCSSSGTGITSGGGTTGGSNAAAYAFTVDTIGSGTAGSIDGYTLDTTTGTFAATAGYSAPAIPADLGVGMVVAQGQYLYAGFRSTGQLYGWSISSTGGLTAVSGSPYTATFLETINAGAVGQQNMIANPAGTLLFFADPIQNEIFVYQIGTAGALTPVSGSPFAAPFAPLNMATDGSGKYLYATDGFFGSHTGTEVAAFTIGSSGTLTPVVGSPFAYPMWQIEGEPSGHYLIGTSGNSVASSGVDDTHLYVFSIQQSGATAGAIAPVAGSPFTTVFSPFTIAVQPNVGGSLLYSFSLNDTDTGYNAIEGYEINSSTGALTAVSGSPFSNLTNGFWGQFDQSGTFLLTYSTIFSSGTSTSQLGPLDIGSGGVLTQPVSPLTLTTGGYWAVTDPQ